MTVAVQSIVHKLRRNIRENSCEIKRQLSRGGSKPDPAVVSSVAKYQETLKKLARE